MFLLGLVVSVLMLGLLSPLPVQPNCLKDDRAIIHDPCKHYNKGDDQYAHYKAWLENALDGARSSHPVKKVWEHTRAQVNVDGILPTRVLNETEARVLLAYARATVKGYKMNNTDPLGDQLVEPLFYFLSKAYEKLQRFGKHTSETLYFVKSDKGGYKSCWPRWPTKTTQPEIAYTDRMKAYMLAGDLGTIYQIKPMAAVNYAAYLNKEKEKVFSPKYLIMPCTQYMVTDREIRDRREFVYLEEMDPNIASSLSSKLSFIPFILLLVISRN